MTESEPQEVPSVDAGQLIMNILRACSSRELAELSTALLIGKESILAGQRAGVSDLPMLVELFNVLKIAADFLLSERPLTPRDLFDLRALGDTPEPGEKPDV